MPPNPPLDPPMLRVLALTTLFPSAARPHFARFIAGSFQALANRPDVALTVIAPVGLPPTPLDRHEHYSALRSLPLHEHYVGLDTYRPRFGIIPGLGWRGNPRRIADAAIPIALGRDFDVVHAEFLFPDAVAAARVAKKLRLPLSIKALGSDIHVWGKRPAARAAMIAAAGQADGVLTVSEGLRQDMIALGFSSENLAVHYTGVALDRFMPADRVVAKAELGLNPAQPLVISVGNLISLKGHHIVIAAIATLPEVALCIIGGGPEAERLAAMIERLDLGGRVRMLGSRSHDEVATWLAAADVMALASENEGLANVWVEALASGTPIVITPVGGAAEIVDTPAAGLLAARTPAAFSTAIAELLAAPPLQSETRKTVERFSWEAHAASLYSHLAGIVAGR